MKKYFLTGTYTEPILFGTGEIFQGKGKGIYLCCLENNSIQIIQHIECRNPSFLCINHQNKKVYAVNEMKEYQGQFGGSLTQISYEKNTFSTERTLGTAATDPCHIALAPNRQFLSVSNFASGAVSIFPLDQDGNITGRKIFQHHGSSIHPIRQKGPHAHATIFLGNEQLMYVPDLGIDIVKAYHYDGSTVTPAPQYDFTVPAGSGPRSGVFSHDHNFFYLIHEISSQVSIFSCKHGKMKFLDCVETLPEGTDKTTNICSDLHITPDQKYLYASNRGHDSLCCYRINENGSLTFLQHTPCGGKTPRNFAIDPSGKYLLAGNQDSDTIVLFAIEPDGHLTTLNVTNIPSPVCIRFF